MRPPACPTALQATELAEALSKAQSGAATCASIRDTAFPLVLRFTSTGLIELWLVRARPCMHYIRSPRSWQPCAVLAAGCCCCWWWWWWWYRWIPHAAELAPGAGRCTRGRGCVP